MLENPSASASSLTLLDRVLLSPRKWMLAVIALLIALLVLMEWTLHIDYSLGVLYIIPMIFGGLVLNRSQTIALAFFCAFARGLFTNVPSVLEYWLRFVMATLAYTCAALLVLEIRRNRQMYIVHVAQLEEQQSLLREAEDQLRLLAESSPAAIMTIDENGQVLAANRSTLEMFNLEAASDLLGRSIQPYLPLLGDVIRFDAGKRSFRTAVQCWGRRTNGRSFLAQTWFSTYVAGTHKRLAAIAVDISEDVRDREEQHLQQLSRNNRVFAGAVSHEIRNLCAAVNVVCSNLGRTPGMAENADFSSLQMLVEGLNRLASFELKNRTQTLPTVQIKDVLNRFMIVSVSSWEDAGGSISIDVPPDLPRVSGDLHELLQVLLNLSQNSLRAVSNAPERKLSISVTFDTPFVQMKICDSGPGVSDQAALFHPFRSGSASSGLGLYVSRALVRNFGGELSYLPTSEGACFLLELILPAFAQNGV
ncbi:MAG TPA: PAS domain-containing sensor histidine kinase [Bryobacteraceae bacterium]|nr:PAS domain-containing sensor histidine kinase [Bryobacteraceae bacterium]HTF71755.1 PAS domain-containing sensor histidine kinase [Edaphobacter sp.]